MERKLSTSWLIEETIARRLEERYRDGALCEELAAYFEDQSDLGSGLPLLVGGVKRRQRTLRRAVEGAVGGFPGGGERRATDPAYPPTANRGVTFHGECEPERITKPACPHIMGGYDGGVEVGFDGKWHELRWPRVLKTLQDAKSAAADHPDGSPEIFELGGRMFAMSGRSAGGGVTYSYVFEGDGVKYYVHEKPCENIQPVRIRYGAEGLIGRDLFIKHGEVREFLHEIGFRVEKEKLSRVDFQVMVYRDVTEFFEKIEEKAWVCKAYDWSIHGRGKDTGAQTLRLGHDIQAVIYDKRAELFHAMKSNPVKVALMVQECFGDEWLGEEIPTTRVEFRLRRKALKDFAIDTMDELMEREAGLVAWLCKRWFRILEEPVRKGHSHEQAVAPCWLEVQEAFAKWFPGVDGHRVEPRWNRNRPLACDGDHLAKQSAGCDASLLALNPDLLGSPREALTFLIRKATLCIDETFNKAVDRCREIAVRTGLFPVPAECGGRAPSAVFSGSPGGGG